MMICSVVKKVIRVLLIGCSILCLTGCSHSSSSTTAYTAKDYADEIVTQLSLQDMEEVKKRVIVGAVFDEKKDVCTDAAMYKSTKEGNNNVVGVFITDDTETCLNYLQSYLLDLKKESENSYPTEVFKISNAVVDSNDKMAVMIVCENIEDAKKEAESILGK